MSKNYETCYTNLITCPYCGYEDSDSWEVFGPYDSECTEINCADCDQEFKVAQHIKVTYSTEKKKL